jgi:predicted signal transduction protein with EAL and GGDEF domain
MPNLELGTVKPTTTKDSGPWVSELSSGIDALGATRCPDRFAELRAVQRPTDASDCMGERQGKQLAVMFVDFHQFKKINDSLSHAVGDKRLRGVARQLNACVRRSDTISRLSGVVAERVANLLKVGIPDGVVH